MTEAHSPTPIVVVLVEDEALVRMLAHDVLSAAGYQVVEGVDADEGLLLLEARPDACALFTDVNMAGSLNGFGLAHLVSKRWPQVGIVVTTGGGDLPGLGDLPEGAHFLPKPYSPSELLALMATVTGGPEALPTA